MAAAVGARPASPAPARMPECLGCYACAPLCLAVPVLRCACAPLCLGCCACAPLCPCLAVPGQPFWQLAGWSLLTLQMGVLSYAPDASYWRGILSPVACRGGGWGAPAGGGAGFCTGTGDGLVVVQEYTKLQPNNNPLAKYLPALIRIMRDGGGADTTGLSGFEAVRWVGRWWCVCVCACVCVWRGCGVGGGGQAIGTALRWVLPARLAS